MAGEVNDARRPPYGTMGAMVFVVGLCSAGAVLLLLAIPLGWAILATLGLAAAALRMVLDIRRNRAMEQVNSI